MRVVLAGLLFAGVCAAISSPVEAQVANPWTVRVRGAVFLPDPPQTDRLGLDADDDVKGELGIGRYLNRYASVELVVGVAKHEVTDTLMKTTNRFGSFKMVPASLYLQFHPMPRAVVQPYVGVGFNATFFFDESGDQQNFEMDASHGVTLQVGADIPLGDRVFLNSEFKYIDMRSTVTTTGAPVNFNINPLVVGVGLGFRF